MPEFDWELGRQTLRGFGGELVTLHVYKTGLPFYDALRLYGAIDLYVGPREDISIHDCGGYWLVSGRARLIRLKGRDIASFKAVRTNKKPAAEAFCATLRSAILSGTRLPREQDPQETVPSDNQDRALDPVLQSGIRGLSAAEYESMNSTSKSQCKAKIPLSEALIAYAGLERTEGVGDIQFLPIFEGRVDLAKIVSPLRSRLTVPNPLCAQVLMLLSLKTALWSEGYDKRLSAVTYGKKTRQTSFSGIIRIASTAIGQIDDGPFCGLLHRVFRRMVSVSWKNKKATPMAPHTLAVAEWLMQPLPRTLSPMISAQEFLLKNGDRPFLVLHDIVRKVFEMTYRERKLDHDAVRRLAKAVSSALYATGPDEKEKRRKHWYDEVVALRNASSSEAFRRRVLTLIEQSRLKQDWIGTTLRDEAFDPVALMASMGEDRPGFEEFRDCFRMYLIQQSAPKDRTIPQAADDVGADVEAEEEEEHAE